MCGFAGVARAAAEVGDPGRVTASLTASLAHRGPDGEGAWQSPRGDVLLVHRRLAIIDPNAEAAQPMATPDGRRRIVFNGEIYNYRELRAGLEARGERFATASDTEVLLRLIAVDGPSSLARVRGMFALACWDEGERALLLARDRFGIKPLYAAALPGTMVFGSEIRALSSAGLVERRASAAGVLAYLAWGSVPAPLTAIDGVEALAPGTWWEWRQDGRERRGAFADLRDAYDPEARAPAGDAEWRAGVGAAVRDSVRAHLVADVPVGVFLSSGVDSSAIVSAAPDSTALKTFTVVFDDPTSEGEGARAVARAFGTDHHELRIDATRVADDLPRILRHLDQPTNDGVNTYYVSQAVAATGIKTVLSGTGGDELFGGYPSFRRLPRAVRARRASGRLWPVLRRAGDRLAPAHLQARWRDFAGSDGTLADAYRAQRGFFMPAEVRSIAGPALLDRWVSASARVEEVERLLLSPRHDASLPAGVARLETRVFLGSQLLRDTDVMAMAHGLEVRVPFVDHELQGAVWPELGRHPRLLAGKRLLAETLDRPLPPSIASRPKQGFTLPLARWMRTELAPFVRDGLQLAAAGGWIAREAPDRVWSQWTAGMLHWTRPWALAVLGHTIGARA